MRTAAWNKGVPIHALRGEIKTSHRAFTEHDIQSIIDEAVAHGMTISAEIAEKLYQDSNFHPMLQDGADNVRLSVIKARDNKVWRKE